MLSNASGIGRSASTSNAATPGGLVCTSAARCERLREQARPGRKRARDAACSSARSARARRPGRCPHRRSPSQPAEHRAAAPTSASASARGLTSAPRCPRSRCARAAGNATRVAHGDVADVVQARARARAPRRSGAGRSRATRRGSARRSRSRPCARAGAGCRPRRRGSRRRASSSPTIFQTGSGPSWSRTSVSYFGLTRQPAAIRVAPRVEERLLRREPHEAREAQRAGELDAVRGRVAGVLGPDRVRTHEQPDDRFVDLAPERGRAEPQLRERAELGELELDARVVVPGVLGREVRVAGDEALVGVEQLVEGRHAIGAAGLRAQRAASARARPRAPRSAATRCRSRRPSRAARPPRAATRSSNRRSVGLERARRRSRARARGGRSRAASPARRRAARAPRAVWPNGGEAPGVARARAERLEPRADVDRIASNTRDRIGEVRALVAVIGGQLELVAERPRRRALPAQLREVREVAAARLGALARGRRRSRRRSRARRRPSTPRNRTGAACPGRARAPSPSVPPCWTRSLFRRVACSGSKRATYAVARARSRCTNSKSPSVEKPQ